MGAGDRVLVLWGRHSSRSRVLIFAIGYVRGCPGLCINQGPKMTAWVEKVTLVGVGRSVWIWQGKERIWSYFNPLELLIETGAGHKYPLSIG